MELSLGGTCFASTPRLLRLRTVVELVSQEADRFDIKLSVGCRIPVPPFTSGLPPEGSSRSDLQMQFNVSSRLDYSIAFNSTLILNIHAQKSAGQKIISESFTLQPQVNWEELQFDHSDARFVRLETGNLKSLTVNYSATVESVSEVVPATEIGAVPVADMDRSAIPYLFPSRYCQSDRLSRLAWDLFGKIANPYEKVVAITEWIYNNVEYVSGTTNWGTSAFDTVTQRTGVCRDFASLRHRLCRALNIHHDTSRATPINCARRIFMLALNVTSAASGWCSMQRV